MDNAIFKELENLYYNNKKGWSKILKSNSKQYLLEALNKEFPNHISLKEKMYWLVNNINCRPKCPICNSEIVEFCRYKGYNRYCSNKCAQLDKNVREKAKSTCIKLYGVDNAAKSEFIKDKIKNTCIAKFGSTNVFASNYGKAKIKETCMLRYGVENPQQNSEIKERTKSTLLKRYNVTCGYLVNKNYTRSKGEIELYDFVKAICSSAEFSNREVIAPFELDVYIPELKLGIEYDGEYWHNLPNMKKRDHIKDSYCRNRNIELIRIKEHDWLNNKQEVKNFIFKRISY